MSNIINPMIGINVQKKVTDILDCLSKLDRYLFVLINIDVQKKDFVVDQYLKLLNQEVKKFKNIQTYMQAMSKELNQDNKKIKDDVNSISVQMGVLIQKFTIVGIDGEGDNLNINSDNSKLLEQLDDDIRTLQAKLYRNSNEKSNQILIICENYYNEFLKLLNQISESGKFEKLDLQNFYELILKFPNFSYDDIDPYSNDYKIVNRFINSDIVQVKKCFYQNLQNIFESIIGNLEPTKKNAITLMIKQENFVGVLRSDDISNDIEIDSNLERLLAEFRKNLRFFKNAIDNCSNKIKPNNHREEELEKALQRIGTKIDIPLEQSKSSSINSGGSCDGELLEPWMRKLLSQRYESAKEAVEAVNMIEENLSRSGKLNITRARKLKKSKSQPRKIKTGLIRIFKIIFGKTKVCKGEKFTPEQRKGIKK